MRFIVAAVAEVVRSVFSGSAFDTNAPTTTRRNRAPGLRQESSVQAVMNFLRIRSDESRLNIKAVNS